MENDDFMSAHNENHAAGYKPLTVLFL